MQEAVASGHNHARLQMNLRFLNENYCAPGSEKIKIE